MEENVQTIKEENVDKVLDSVSDAYLAKKKKNRKIIFSAISSVLLVLCTVIIVLSCIKINIKPSFIKDVSTYEISINGNTIKVLDEISPENSKEFKEFDNLFEETFSYNYLNALFSGKFGGYEIEETPEQFYSNTVEEKGKGSYLTSQLQSLGNNYVRVKLAEAQTVKYKNGEVYKPIYNSASYLTFSELYFNINSTDEESELTFFLGASSETTSAKVTKITVKANTYSLYQFAIND